MASDRKVADQIEARILATLTDPHRREAISDNTEVLMLIGLRLGQIAESLRIANANFGEIRASLAQVLERRKDEAA